MAELLQLPTPGMIVLRLLSDAILSEYGLMILSCPYSGFLAGCCNPFNLQFVSLQYNRNAQINTMF